MKRCILWFMAVLVAAQAVAAPDTKTLSARQLEELAAPVALYPDPLLGLILPASVFPDQIVDAALLIKDKSDAELISKQDWDASVKGIATYPGVLKMMFEKIDWTTKLGDAFINQSDGLRDAIQTLRLKAQKVGNLKTTEEQQVSTTEVKGETVIRIEPTEPEVIYVPQYSTQVYTEPAPSSSNYLVPLATFGLGMALGSAMNDDDDDVYVYGGYPGRVAWYDNDSVDHWVDNRQDMIRDAQGHRQDMQKDRMNYHQDMKQDRQQFRQDQIESGNFKDSAARQDFKNQQAGKRQEYANSTKESRANNRASMASSSDYQARKQQAQQRSQEWKSSASDRGYGGNAASARQSAGGSGSGFSYAPPSRNSSGNAFNGYSSRSTASAYGSRGSASRASSGGYSSRSSSSRSGSYGGRSGGGASRGGGGGRRR